MKRDERAFLEGEREETGRPGQGPRCMAAVQNLALGT